MNAKEERAIRSNFWRPCSLWCIHLEPAQLYSECLHLDSAHRGDCTGCIHLDPAQLQHHHPIPGPKSHSSQESIRGTRITLCALDYRPSSIRRVTSDVAWVFTYWPSPLLHPSPSTKVKVLRESFKDLDLERISLYSNFEELSLVSLKCTSCEQGRKKPKLINWMRYCQLISML